MNGRLASFRGPSTPISSPVPNQRYPIVKNTPPASPSRVLESTFHRKIRVLLIELRVICQTFDELVSIDGLKAAKSLVDARTNLDNALASLPSNEPPHYRIIGPRLRIMDKHIADLDGVISKLRKQFRKMSTLVDNLEAVLCEAHKVKGWQWVEHEPLWVTWSMNKFVTSISAIVVPYHRSLQMHTDIVQTLRSHSVSFEASRKAIDLWVAQPAIEDGGWNSQWEDLCQAEIDRWDVLK